MASRTALPLDQTVIRLELLARLMDELEKRGYVRDLVADDPKIPCCALADSNRDFATCVSEILIIWHVSGSGDWSG